MWRMYQGDVKTNSAAAEYHFHHLVVITTSAVRHMSGIFLGAVLILVKVGFNMKGEQSIREVLINNTIRLIAEGGFEKATTKAITYSGGSLSEVKLNEVYIYRLFGSKEHLYAVAFESLDKEFVLTLHKCLAIIKSPEGSVKERLYEGFLRSWNFILTNESRCRCYVRYYYSVYFRGESLAIHNKIFAEIVDLFSPLFKEEADVKSIMHSVLTTLLDFAIRVYNGDLENSDINIIHVFNVLYCTMMTYFKDEIKTETPTPHFI